MSEAPRSLVLALAALAACAGGWQQPRPADQPRDAGPSIPPPAAAAEAPRPACDPGNGGITLPPGFCAVVFADSVGAPRHIAVAANGDVYAALAGRRKGPAA